ncbi:MAG: tetratricopeptide repeat protein [Acidobacteriota bacterium]
MIAHGPAYGASIADEDERLYVEAIKAWLTDPGDISATMLIGLEANAPGPRLERLDEAEERVVNDLARLDPAALLPIAALHRFAYDRHLEDGSKRGVRHSARRLRDVVDLYARRSGSPDARAAAGRQWAALALSLLARGGEHLGPAVACLSEGLGHLKPKEDHPDVRDARIRTLHIRTITLERIGTPAKALDDLKDLLKLDPEHHEAQLRRAVSLMQAGRLDDAEPRLKELFESPVHPPWIRIVAAQQLARLQLDADRTASALGTLRTAHSHFPENHRILTLLAFAERPQWETSNTRVRRVLDESPGGQATRPRTRYEGPMDDDIAIRQQVADDLQAHLVAARAAIARWEAERVDQ